MSKKIEILGPQSNSHNERCVTLPSGERVYMYVPSCDGCGDPYCQDELGKKIDCPNCCEGEDCPDDSVVCKPCADLTPSCWKDKFIEGGLDNTFTSFKHTGQNYTVTFDNGDVDTFSFASATNWSDQVQQMADGLGSIMPWAQTVDSFCNILPNGCGGLQAPVVVLNQMFARYVGFRVCPGDKVPVVIEYTSDQRTKPVKLVVQYVETDIIYLDRCVSCNGTESEWTTIGGEPYEPVCAIPCGDEFPETPLALCETTYTDGCDNVNSTITEDFVNITRAITDCGDGPEVVYLIEDDGALDIYEIVGEFVDCATGEPIPEPEPECDRTTECWYTDIVKVKLDNQSGGEWPPTYFPTPTVPHDYRLTLADGTICEFSLGVLDGGQAGIDAQLIGIQDALNPCIGKDLYQPPKAAPDGDLGTVQGRYVEVECCADDPRLPIAWEAKRTGSSSWIPLTLEREVVTLEYQKCVCCGEDPIWYLDGEVVEEPAECLRPCVVDSPAIPPVDNECSTDIIPGQWCDVTISGDPDVDDTINQTDILITVVTCPSGQELIYQTIVDENELAIYTPIGEIVDCETLEPPVVPPPPCDPDAVFEQVCLPANGYGILDNSLWDDGAASPTPHLKNGVDMEITLYDSSGAVLGVLGPLSDPYFNSFMGEFKALFPDCTIKAVCANHTSPKGCVGAHVANLAAYPAYDAPTHPADVQNNLSNPSQDELWATGWLIDCAGCTGPVARAEITNSSDPAWIGVAKNIITYEGDEQTYFRAITPCNGVFWKDCDGNDIPEPPGGCCAKPCGADAAPVVEEPDCPQAGIVTPIGSRPLTRAFGAIGNGDAGPHVINDFTGPIQTEACQTGDFTNNGIVSNAFDLGLTGSAPQTCITVDQTAACAAGTAFVLFDENGIALPAISSGASGWQLLGPYAYDSSTGTDVVVTQLCYDTTGVDLAGLVFVGFGTGGFGNDTSCCDAYTVVSDVANCTPSSGGGGCCPELPIAECSDPCFESAVRLTQGRPGTGLWEYAGFSGNTISELEGAYTAATGGKAYITNQNGTGDGTGSNEAHWMCPATDGAEVTFNGVPIRDPLVLSPNPYAEELGCESKEALLVKICGSDVANKYCEVPREACACIDGVLIQVTYFEDPETLNISKFRRTDTMEVLTEAPQWADCCGTCDSEGKDYEVEFKSSGIQEIVTDCGTWSGNYDFIAPLAPPQSSDDAGSQMQQAKIAIDAWLAANGGGTVRLEYVSTSILNITITGATCVIQTASDDSNPGPHNFTEI